ncbi:MAG: hypothetical protein PHW01_01470 [Patescibacteria group bacterium]|nr:hypothetical protein [Patescibacteria group bacterium]
MRHSFSIYYSYGKRSIIVGSIVAQALWDHNADLSSFLYFILVLNVILCSGSTVLAIALDYGANDPL